MTVKDHPLPEAAELLGCKLRWLQDNYSRFEHQGYGKSVSFTDAQLDKIRAACVVPGSDMATQPTPAAKPKTAGRIPVTELRPRQRTRVG